MNWNLILLSLCFVFGILGVIIIAYFLPAFILRSERKDRIKKASIKEKIWAYLRAIGIVVIASSLFSYMRGREQSSYFIIAVIVIGLPVILSVAGYFEKNDKMTITERIIEQIKIHKEEEEASKMHTD